MRSLVSYLIHQALLLILQKNHVAPLTRYVALLDLDCLYAQSKDIRNNVLPSPYYYQKVSE